MNKKILVVEDEMVVAGDIRLTLEQAGYEVTGVARTYHRALEMIELNRPFLVLLDIFLKGNLTGIDLAIKLNELRIPFIYLSANSNQQVLESAKLTNPYGFIVKPFREKDVLVNLEIARYRLEQDQQIKAQTVVRKLYKPVVATSLAPAIPNFQGIVGETPQMKDIFELISQVAPLTTSILILGESGTGKEGIANAIHHLSPRKDKPFIKINCAALPIHLVESELFGHEKGAFTGAYDRKIGKFELANGGTLLLDEIGEMSPDMQVKLLRVLQEREIERIGGKSTIKVDVRIIAATNKNLEKETGEGRFRLDLYYRLHVFPIMVPALRDRKDDIPLLTKYFIAYYAEKNNRPVQEVSDQAMSQLMKHDWPGNVRELEHVLERSLLMSKGSVIKEIAIAKTPGNNKPTAQADGPVKTMQELETDHIMAVLKKCSNRISGAGGAAELLDLPPSTLYSKMKKLGISRNFNIE